MALTSCVPVSSAEARGHFRLTQISSATDTIGQSYLMQTRGGKVIMVDGRFCTVGSANLNSRSLRFDLEENAVIIDPNVTQQLSDMFDHDKADSFYLTPETWNQFRTRWQKTVGWFAHLLAPWL